MRIERYTCGTGNRFTHQAKAPLRAIRKARENGIDVYPVWNKSNREHLIVQSKPDDVSAEADAAVTALGWTGAYQGDVDPIGLNPVDAFIPASNFFTVDAADFTAKAAHAERHVDSAPPCNPHFRQRLHVGIKVSAGMSNWFPCAVAGHEAIVARNATETLFDRHG